MSSSMNASDYSTGAQAMARQTASANSNVDVVPPRSRVREMPRRQHRVECRHDPVRGRHPRRCAAASCTADSSSAIGIREVLAGDVRRAAVHGFEHAHLRAEIRRPDHAEPADQARRTDPTRCRRTGSASPARRTARASSPGACRRRRRSSRRRQSRGSCARRPRTLSMNRPSLNFMMLAL